MKEEREGRGKWFKVKERRKGTSGRKRTKTFFFVNTVTWLRHTMLYVDACMCIAITSPRAGQRVADFRWKHCWQLCSEGSFQGSLYSFSANWDTPYENSYLFSVLKTEKNVLLYPKNPITSFYVMTPLEVCGFQTLAGECHTAQPVVTFLITGNTPVPSKFKHNKQLSVFKWGSWTTGCLILLSATTCLSSLTCVSLVPLELFIIQL